MQLGQDIGPITRRKDDGAGETLWLMVNYWTVLPLSQAPAVIKLIGLSL